MTESCLLYAIPIGIDFEEASMAIGLCETLLSLNCLEVYFSPLTLLLLSQPPSSLYILLYTRSHRSGIMLSLLSFVLLATTSLVSAQSGSAKTTR